MFSIRFKPIIWTFFLVVFFSLLSYFVEYGILLYNFHDFTHASKVFHFSFVSLLSKTGNFRKNIWNYKS